MIRVCQLHHYYLPGLSGAALRSHNQARIMTGWGHRTWVLTPRYPGLLDEEILDGIRVVRAPIHGRSRMQQFFTFMFSASRELVRRREDFDLMHLFSFGPFQLIPVLAAKALGKRILYQMTIMGSNSDRVAESRRYSRVVRMGLHLVDGFTVLSTPMLQAFEGESLRDRPLRVIPNGVETDLYRPASVQEKVDLRKRLGLEQEASYICFVGGVHERKGVDVLVSAFEEVADQCPNARLLIVGPDTFVKPGFEDERNKQTQIFADSLKQKVQALGLADRVIFTGGTDRVSNYLRASDMFVFPSRREGFPNVVIEAMASGLPCIVSHLAGISEDIIRDGLDGYIVRDHEPSLYAKLVLQLLADPTRSEQIGRAARHTVEQRFRLEDVVRQYVSLCRELLEA